jgi:hypothetical protein
VKLYNVPRETWILVGSERIFFDHIDGMYSYCLTVAGKVCHLAAWTEVEIIQ